MDGSFFRTGRGLALALLAVTALAFGITYAVDPLRGTAVGNADVLPDRGGAPLAAVGEPARSRATTTPAHRSESSSAALTAVTLPRLGALDLMAAQASDQKVNPHGLLRGALQTFVSRAVARARPCMPPDTIPTVARVHLRVESRAYHKAEVLEALDLSVQRGAPLSEAATRCLLETLRRDLPQPVLDVSTAALPDFHGDATVLIALKLNPACGL